MNKVKPKKTLISKKKNVRKGAMVPTEIVEGNEEEYEKILMLVQEHIEQTGEHGIMEFKRRMEYERDEEEGREKKEEKREVSWVDEQNRRGLKRALKPIVEKEEEEESESEEKDLRREKEKDVG